MRVKGNWGTSPLEEMSINGLIEKLDTLATFSERPVYSSPLLENGQPASAPEIVPNFKAIWNDKRNECATIASSGYLLLQHKEVFAPLLEVINLTMPDAKVKASVNEYKGKAQVNVVFEHLKAQDGSAGIEIGLSLLNSGDRTTSLRLGSSQANYNATFEIFALRLACSNGMIVKVPNVDFNTVRLVDRATAQVGDFIGSVVEEVRNREETTSVKSVIRHYGKQAQIEATAISNHLLKLPFVVEKLEEQVRTAQEIGITQEEAEKELNRLGFCPRTQKAILAGFVGEEPTVWGLYNAGTALFSHSDKISMMAVNSGLGKLAPMLSR
jgi:hypothetical protein